MNISCTLNLFPLSSGKEVMRILNFNKLNRFQKQPPQGFYIKRYAQKFRKIHRKPPVPESFFTKLLNFIKKETLA